MDIKDVAVLNVDDHAASRYIRTRILQNAGFRVSEARTGHDALQLIRQEKPGLILLDVNLPDLHGFEVCRRIRSDSETATIPVVHISASAVAPSDAVHGLEGGADAYLTEPVEPGVLIATARTLLRAYGAMEELARVKDELAAQLADMTRLHALSVRISPADGYESILKDVLAAVTGLQNSRMGVLMLTDPGREDLYTVASVGFTQEYLDLVGRERLGVGVCGTAVARSSPVVVEDVETDPIFAPYIAAARLAGYRAAYCTPLPTQRGEMVGAIATYFERPHRPPPREMYLTELYARRAAEVIDNARLLKERERLLHEQVLARKQAEEFAAEAERRAREAEEGRSTLEALMEHIPEGITIVKRDGRIRMISRHGCELAGRPREELEGVRIPDYAETWGILRADGARSPSRDELPLARALEGDVVTDEKWLIQRPDGSRITILSNAGPIRDREGSISGGVMAWREITALEGAQEELRKREAQLALAQRLARLGSWEWEPTTGRITCSDEFSRIFDLDRSAPLSFESVLSCIHPEDREAVKRAVDEGIRQRQPFAVQHRIVCGDGSVRTVYTEGEVRFGVSEKPLHLFGTAQDITERMRTEETIRQAQKLESIGVLAGGIAHAFNNLLTGVMGNASLMLDEAPEELKQSLAAILTSADRGAYLTRQLLAFAGKGQFVVQDVDLSELVRDTEEILRVSIPKKVEARFELRKGLPPIRADFGQIQQVILNLVTNAAEAIVEGGAGTITISTGVQEISEPFVDCLAAQVAPGQYVYLEVKDTGTGIDGTIRERLFEPFFTTKFMGRGLGLAAVGGIVRTQKGAITFSTAPGQGSTFRVAFPAPAREVSASAAHRKDLHGAGGVLVVDDEAIVRHMLRSGLERYGYTVLEARDGREALSVLEEEADRVCLVLLDLSMPSMSGDEMFRIVRQRWPGLKVLITSGHPEREALRTFAGEEIAGFLQKPYTVHHLAEKIKAAMES
jgi:PAS domain S-box-containing protein